LPFPDAAFAVAGTDGQGTVFGIHAVDTVRESGQLVVTHAKAISLRVEQ